MSKRTSCNEENSSATLSKDGKWRSFPKIPCLLQYVSTGTYYARIKRNGKIIRHSLKTDVRTTAKLRLVDFLKEHQQKAPEVTAPTFQEAVEMFKEEVKNDTSIKDSYKAYLIGQCLLKIERSWADLRSCSIDRITPAACKEWAARIRGEISATFFNNTIATFRRILQLGIKEHLRRGGNLIPNPAGEIARARHKQKPLHLPEADQFRELVKDIRAASGGWGRRAGDLVEFLTYSGTRLNEALRVKWEDIDWKRKEIIILGDPETGTKNWDIRRVPILPNMEVLLTQMLADRVQSARGKLLECDRCYESLKRACDKLGIPRLSHHDLRHLFATRCIEAGVDIPTVARWLGHKDGGALAMKTYGHLRNEHSQAMAQKVRF